MSVAPIQYQPPISKPEKIIIYLTITNDFLLWGHLISASRKITIKPERYEILLILIYVLLVNYMLLLNEMLFSYKLLLLFSIFACKYCWDYSVLTIPLCLCFSAFFFANIFLQVRFSNKTAIFDMPLPHDSVESCCIMISKVNGAEILQNYLSLYWYVLISYATYFNEWTPEFQLHNNC